MPTPITIATASAATAGANSLRCIINKMFEFRERVNAGSYEVAGAAETWSNESINDAELHIEGYNMYRKDRKRTRGG